MTEEMTKSPGLELWNQVCTTDPVALKKVELGRRKFSDIDITYSIKRATELWGPFGGNWGLRGQRITMLGDVGMLMEAEFYYPYGAFPIAADLQYESRGETAKKLQTTCIGKALSRLGFHADVYEGRFDDSAYRGLASSPVEQQQITHSPDQNATRLLGMAASRFDAMKPEGRSVLLGRVYDQVWTKFGKWPTTEASVDLIVREISLEDVLNDCS